MNLAASLCWAVMAIVPLALGQSYTDTDCVTRYNGVCHSIYTGCPSGYSHYTFSSCSFLSQCCYNTATSGPVTATPSPTSSNTGGQTSAQCGTRDYAGGHRIVGGTQADVKEYPWQVSVRYFNIHLCGGTLIDNQHVLTAAHCFAKTHYSNRWSVAIGTNDISHISSSSSHLVPVSQYWTHELYNNYTNENDIAIMKLSKPVDITGSYVRSACLPQAGVNLDNRVCTVTGWGDTKNDLESDKYLREVDIPIMSNSMCSYYINGRGQGVVTSKQVCAGLSEGGKDACQGDSGGPLVCEDNGTWSIVGIVSWGYGCALRNLPGIYTRVSEYLDWIHRTVQL